MSRHHSESLHEGSMRQRDPYCGRDSNSTGHAGNDLNRNPSRHAGLHFLSTATENERVAAFEPDYSPTSSGMLNQQPVDLILRGRRTARDLGDVDDLNMSGQLSQDLGRRQPVRYYDVGLEKPGMPTTGE
jgi:hypothetical protein